MSEKQNLNENAAPHNKFRTSLYLYKIIPMPVQTAIKVFDRNRLIYKTIELYYFQCKKSINNYVKILKTGFFFNNIFVNKMFQIKILYKKHIFVKWICTKKNSIIRQ